MGCCCTGQTILRELLPACVPTEDDEDLPVHKYIRRGMLVALALVAQRLGYPQLAAATSQRHFRRGFAMFAVIYHFTSKTTESSGGSSRQQSYRIARSSGFCVRTRGEVRSPEASQGLPSAVHRRVIRPILGCYACDPTQLVGVQERSDMDRTMTVR